jgi:H+/Cl- antiporter ClcA
MVAGLALAAGAASLQDSWLWMAIGLLAALKGVLLLALSDAARSAVFEWWRGKPVWAVQIAGVASMALATLLAIDLIRAGR